MTEDEDDYPSPGSPVTVNQVEELTLPPTQESPMTVNQEEELASPPTPTEENHPAGSDTPNPTEQEHKSSGTNPARSEVRNRELGSAEFVTRDDDKDHDTGFVESGDLHCLIAANNKLVDGYHSEIVKRLGIGRFGGLHTEATFRVGPSTPSTLNIRFRVQHGNGKYFLAAMQIPLDSIKGDMEVESVLAIDTSDDDLMHLLNTWTPTTTIFDNGHLATQDQWSQDVSELSEVVVDEDRPGTFIKLKHDQIRRITFTIPARAIQKVYTKEFAQPVRSIPECCIQALEDLRDFVEKLKGDVTFHIAYDNRQTWILWADRLRRLKDYSAPFAPFIGRARGTARDLTFGNFDWPDKLPEKPAPASTMFTNEEHRMTSLMGGVVEEVEMLRQRVEKLKDTTIQVSVISNAYDKWTEQPDDLQVYGVTADGSPLSQYFVVHCQDIASLLPDVGENCSFYIPMTTPRRELPERATTHTYIDGILPGLVRAVGAARQATIHSTDPEAPEDVQQAALDRFGAEICAIIYPTLKSPTDAIKALAPDANVDEQRLLTAVMQGHEIAAAINSGGDVNETLMAWAIQSAGASSEMPKAPGEPWHAKRLPLPPGTTANIALFLVHTASQQNWPADLRKPPLNPGFPAYKLPRTGLAAFLKTFDPSIGTGDEGETQRMTIPVTCFWQPNEESAKKECHALSELATVRRDSRASTLMEWLLDFQTKPPAVGFTNLFPQLRQDIEAGLITGEHATVLEGMQDVNGYAFLNGGPGSGKSKLGGDICRAVMARDDKVVWIAPSNALVQDACERLAMANPGKIVKRMLPWKREFDFLTTIAQEPAVENPASGKGITSSDKALARHVNWFRIMEYDAKSPSRIEASMSQFAKSIAESNAETWEVYLTAQHSLRHSPDEYTANKVANDEAARNLLLQAIAECDAICTTPVAFAQMVSHFEKGSFNAAFIVVDEAGRLTETASLVSVLQCPDTPHLFIGDNDQFQPIAIARDDRDFKDTFGPQRGVSCLLRVEQAGMMTATLHDNFRARGGVADFANEYLYRGRMNIVNSKRGTLTFNMQKWLGAAMGQPTRKSPVWMVEFKNAEEGTVGTSFANPLHAVAGRDFLVSVYQDGPIQNALKWKSDQELEFGTTLIITAYAAQKNEWEGVLAELSPAELPKQLVQVRTIDDSPSHEADLVIVDLTRSTAQGFLKDINRITVMTTRARYAMVVFGNRACIGKFRKSALNRFFEFLQHRSVIVSFDSAESKKRLKICHRCHQQGHISSDCSVTLNCSICAGLDHKICSPQHDHNHSLRRCPHANEAPFPVQYREPADRHTDGVARAPLLSVGSGQGRKRSKFRNSAKPVAPHNVEQQMEDNHTNKGKMSIAIASAMAKVQAEAILTAAFRTSAHLQEEVVPTEHDDSCDGEVASEPDTDVDDQAPNEKQIDFDNRGDAESSVVEKIRPDPDNRTDSENPACEGQSDAWGQVDCNAGEQDNAWQTQYGGEKENATDNVHW
ncbi:hypothetical protein BGZ63DRAFT_419061 [Mariannaea sp. PMI_226]|nr:hypothetical protein BGZ63DRAFT_419061 [Mariannaea sp. PMI_226]